MYYCFGCGAGGNVFNFIMEYENYTFGEALKHLADRRGWSFRRSNTPEKSDRRLRKKQELLEINKQAAQYFYYQLRTEKGQTGLDYLKNRGLSEETMRKFGLGYSDRAGGACTAI